MSDSVYQQLLQLAFPTPADATAYLTPPTRTAYSTLEHADRNELAFRFERVRLAVAMSLMKLLADLGDHAESRAVLDLLHRALRAGSAKEIDAIITKDAKLFDRLYTDLYVNETGEQVLHLFEETLDADSFEGMDDIIRRAVQVAQEADFSASDDDDTEE